MWEMQVSSLIQEDPTCSGATKPMSHNYCTCALELGSRNCWAHVLRACALQQEKTLQWEVCTPQLESSPHLLQLEQSSFSLLQLEKSPCSSKDPAQPKVNKWNFIYIYIYIYIYIWIRSPDKESYTVWFCINKIQNWAKWIHLEWSQNIGCLLAAGTWEKAGGKLLGLLMIF